MKLSSKILAGFAAGSLLVAQSASATALPARESADIDQSEAVGRGATPVIALLVLIAIIFGIMALTDSEENGPHSP
jgi:flagellin-like protein